MPTTPPALRPIDQPPATLRELVLERLREAIIEGELQSGERLVERTLCARLGVSRTVVRETLRYLEAEGLVETQAHRGPIVAPMNADLARQIYDIRRQLETRAAARAAELADNTVGEELRRALAEIEAAGGGAMLLRATTRFYELIFAAAGHRVAWEIVQRLNGRISRLRALTLATAERPVSGLARIRAICEAVAAGNPAAAAAAVEAHLDEASTIALRLLAENRPEIEQER